MNTKNDPIDMDRVYIAQRKGDQVTVTLAGPCGLEIPILGAVRNSDGILLVETAIPVPSEILRECLAEAERVMLNGGEE